MEKNEQSAGNGYWCSKKFLFLKFETRQNECVLPRLGVRICVSGWETEYATFWFVRERWFRAVNLIVLEVSKEILGLSNGTVSHY
jgi:hypothetical protein